MAKTNLKETEAARQENIEAKVSASEQFYNENKKTIWTVVIAILVIGLVALGYSKFIYQPKCQEAMEQAFPAEQSFAAGEYELALNGDGNVLGLAQIIDDYGAKAGTVIYLDAAICALNFKDYEMALEYVAKYNGKEPILAARALACKGAAYVGLQNYDAAVKAYKNAAAKADNIFTAGYLLNAGVCLEKIGDKAAALELYKTIKDKYPQSIEGYDIDKYIARAEAE